MDRIKQIWIESSRSTSPLDSPSPLTYQQRQQHDSSCMSSHVMRPPPLRTSNTFDDDETFQNVGLNLLARYESLEMSAQQVILATLISPKHRASFWEGLCVRLNRSNNSNHELIRALEQTFGKDLHELVQAESKEATESAGAYNSFYSSNNPVAPRHTSTTTTALRRPSLPSQKLHEGGGGASLAVPEQPEISMSSSSGSMSLGGKSQYSHHSNCSYNKTKKTTPRRFFPDDCYSFFRSKRRVQNIDWKLAEAVKQVEHLQLDGMATSPALTTNNNQQAYAPPTSG